VLREERDTPPGRAPTLGAPLRVRVFLPEPALSPFLSLSVIECRLLLLLSRHSGPAYGPARSPNCSPRRKRALHVSHFRAPMPTPFGPTSRARNAGSWGPLPRPRRAAPTG